jgi:dethiobiotin synthetase
MAPARAARLHDEEISLSAIHSCWEELSSSRDRFWIVEGAGGLLVPIAGKQTMADLAQALELPIVIVASPRLGGMNHVLLTLEAAQRRGLEISGVLWVGSTDPGIEQSLEPWLRDIPWVERIPEISPINQTQIHAAARGLKCWTAV